MKMPNLILFILISAIVKAEQPKYATETTSSCGPIPATCLPGHLMGGFGFGIVDVQLNQINNLHSDTAGYQDYTCTDSTWLNAGTSYLLHVHTSQANQESLTAWIDFNNDGMFDPSERIYHDSAFVYHHTGYIIVPTNAPNTFTPIRMRLGSDYSGNPPLTGCNPAMYGHYEDYTVYYGINIGINEADKNVPATIVPNPFHAEAVLRINGSHFQNYEGQEAVIKIYNSTGALVRNESVQVTPAGDVIIDRKNLIDGFYFYKLFSPESTLLVSGKFVTE